MIPLHDKMVSIHTKLNQKGFDFISDLARIAAELWAGLIHYGQPHSRALLAILSSPEKRATQSLERPSVRE
jgi:hypothetical protein